MIGMRFGKQVVLRDAGAGNVEIQCDCGTVKVTRKQYLTTGQSKSCGCGRRGDRAERPVAVGDVFGQITVIQRLGSNGDKKECLTRCSCGANKVVAESDLRSGEIKSCGCYRKARMGKLNITHGESGKRRSALYNTWLGMKRRCTTPERYPTYAGISVCKEWMAFEAFRDYINGTLGPRPAKHSIDRIDNTKNYMPGNVRWSDSRAQALNRSSNVAPSARRRTKKK